MNRFPLWKYVLLFVVLGLGVLYAMPNLYRPDPAIQITGSSQAARVDEALVERARAALREADIEFFGEQISEDGRTVLFRLHEQGHQLPAQRAVQLALQTGAGPDQRFVVALNQATTTPAWLESLGASRMNLGLDLAGGVHFLLEVDTPQAINDRLEDMEQSVRRNIREQRLFNVTVAVEDQSLLITTESEEHQQGMIAFLRDEMPQLDRQRGRNNDGTYWVRAAMSSQAVQEIEDHAVNQNLTTLRNRVNELGVSEPLVQKQGRNRIVVELPGIQDTAGAKMILGKTANLEFRLEATPNTPSYQREEFEFYDEQERRQRGSAYLERRRIITGERVVNAVAGFDQQSNSPKIDITLDSEGGSLMHHVTRHQVGRNMGVLFIDYYEVTELVEENGEWVEKVTNVADRKIINLATIRSALGVRFQITGLGSSREANDVALLLRAGSLAAPMRFVEERTIGPSLGAENIRNGVVSVQLGLAMVLIFMIFFYKVFGIAASLALGFNLVLLVALMSMLGATLTLPGIAGIVLTVGMAVDANVLIFSRIKEELRNGLPPQSAIHSGFERAFTTILDANLTTLIVAFILFAIGTGPIKGFAITLSLGILTSMFTAIIGTRAVINLIYGGRKVNKLWI